MPRLSKSLPKYRRKQVRKGNSRRYINQNIGRIKRMFRWGVSRELIRVETCHRLQTVAGLRKGKCQVRETAPILPIDDAIVDATIAHMNPIVADMVRIQRLTGCRPGEVCALRPGDIDRDSYPRVWLYYPRSHKMEHRDRSRVIPIGPYGQAVLTKYLLRADDDHCFQRRCGQPFERIHYYQHIRRACDKAFPPPEGLAGNELAAWRRQHRWAPNRLRHSAGTQLRSQFGLEATKVVLGHANIETSQIYAERDLARAVEIMAEVG